MRFSDVQLSDQALWTQFKHLYETGDYDAASGLLDVGQLAKKSLTADALNELTSYLVQVEELNDPNFKADKIQLSRRPPVGMTSGQVYFRWLAPYLFNEVDALGYTFNEVDNLNITWAQADEGGW